MKLRDYQLKIVEEAMDIIKQKGLVYLALETRLGKTAISLTIAKNLNNKIRFVTIKKAMSSIQSDIQKIKVGYVEVISMDSLHKYSYEDNTTYIIDEAHNFGSYPKPSKRTLDLCKLIRHNVAIYLSGTPTPESLSQIFWQLQTSYQSPFSEYKQHSKSFYSWSRAYVDVYQKRINSLNINFYDKAKKELILPIFDQYKISMTKKDCGFSFDKVNEEVLEVAMDNETRDMYYDIKQTNYHLGFFEVACESAAIKMSKMHQLCGGTIIVDDTYYILDDSKIKTIKNIIAQGNKVGIYYKFKSEKQLLLQHLHTTESPEEFNLTNDKVFISQYRSGREGVDLRTADLIIFYNPDYSFLSYEQTKNRLQSYDREKQPKVLFLISDLGLDMEIVKRVRNKKKFTTQHFKRMFG